MSGPFAPGDVVVCVDAGPLPHPNIRVLQGGGLREGHLYRVTKCWIGFHSRVPFVRVAGYPYMRPDSGNQACRFRKIDPASDEFTQTIRACKPAKPSLNPERHFARGVQ